MSTGQTRKLALGVFTGADAGARLLVRCGSSELAEPGGRKAALISEGARERWATGEAAYFGAAPRAGRARTTAGQSVVDRAARVSLAPPVAALAAERACPARGLNQARENGPGPG